MISLDYIKCVRWSPSGDMLATASCDKSAKVIEFKTGKVLHSGTTSDESKLFLSFISMYISIMTRSRLLSMLHLAKHVRKRLS